jgi:hypothetical protein
MHNKRALRGCYQIRNVYIEQVVNGLHADKKAILNEIDTKNSINQTKV